MSLSIAMDGPVGAGKSSIADAVAKKLDIIHLDTGAMYRAVGLAALNNGVDLQDERAVMEMCEKGLAEVGIVYCEGRQRTLLCGVDVSSQIREQRVGEAASAISRYKDVRAMLVRRQQEIAAQQDMLIDGRDICSVVLPGATVKIYLTASAEARALRRQKQLEEKGNKVSFEEILEEVNARDWQDMHREADPLRIAEDATVLDSSEMDFDETVEAVLQLVREAQK